MDDINGPVHFIHQACRSRSSTGFTAALNIRGADRDYSVAGKNVRQQYGHDERSEKRYALGRHRVLWNPVSNSEIRRIVWERHELVCHQQQSSNGSYRRVWTPSSGIWNARCRSGWGLHVWRSQRSRQTSSSSIITRRRRISEPRFDDFSKRLEPQKGMQVVYARTTIVSDREQVKKLVAWTLFGPYASGRRGSLRTGPQLRICNLALSGTRQNT